MLRSGRRRRLAPVSREKTEQADKYVKTRAAVAAAKKNEQKISVIEISESDNDVRKEEEEMGDESGGLSANKGVPQEDEGNTTPFPERV